MGGFLKDAGVEVLICGGIGQGARDVLAEQGIELISGAQGSVDDAVLAYLKGELADSPLGFCDHHDHFRNTTPESEWQACLEHAEKIGLGSRDYELITV